MKNNYRVWFSNCNYSNEYVEVQATDQNDAFFIAKAQRINEDLDSTLDSIEDIMTYQRIEELERAVILLTSSYPDWDKYVTAENVELIDRLVKEIEDNSCQKT